MQPPLEQAAADEPAAEAQSISRNKWASQCFMYNLGKHQPLINGASGYGIHLPTASGELQSICSNEWAFLCFIQ